MYEESRTLAVDVAAIRATVERLAVEQDHLRGDMLELRRERRADTRDVRSQLFRTQLVVLATFATTVGVLLDALLT